ncbi:hypothetical protein V1525DRAFT_395389 [Lipomyces kononenkoae]|uniref:Uncharacterized protein n=1 Tax=Lipomyces kononenkoae TaxID=34357 RepID=A0ACC3T9D8_LIPKO
MPRSPRTAPTSSVPRAGQSQLKYSTRISALVPIWFLTLQLLALVLFALGFLLSRPVLPDIAVKSTTYSDPDVVLPRGFNRVVVILIDALRHDFITSSDNNNGAYYLNALTTPSLLSVAEPEHAAVFKFIADPPTTTLQRLKALTTGSLPTFIDAGSNFNGAEVTEDSWIQQVHSSRGHGRIAFAGDDTWLSLFPSLSQGTYEGMNLTFPYESFNVWDLHTVDAGVTSHLWPLLQRRDDWDILIAHYLGVDHAGHRFGPNTPQMKEKLLEMEAVLKSVVNAIKDDDETLLVVLGDHGMDEKGDHGGDSKGEVEAGLFLYSSRPFLAPADQAETVNQIDLVPTLSFLLDLPVPFNNLGSPIASAMLGTDYDFQKLASASRIVAEQIHQYRSHHPSFEGMAELTEVYGAASEAWNMSKDYESISKLYLAYQEQNLKSCREMWARFDVPSMVAGTVIFVATLGTLLVFYFTFDGEVECPSDHLNFLAPKVGYGGLVGLVTGAGLGFLQSRLLIVSVFGVGMGSIIGFCQGMRRLPRIKSAVSKWTVLALLSIVLHGILFASNSYVVWEARSLSFLLVSFGFIFLAASFRLPDAKTRATAVLHAIMFIIQSRLAEYPRICREEQLPFCTSNFYASTASSVSSLPAILVLFGTAFAFPAIIRSFLRTSASYEGSAPLWIGIGLRAVLVLVALYWTLDYVEANPNAQTYVEVLKIYKYIVSRVLFGVTVIGAPLAWFRGFPLCLRVEMTNNQQKIKQAVQNGDVDTASKTAPVSVEVIGFGNTYGSLYLLLFVSIFAAVALCMKPVGGIAMAVMVYQVMTLLELGDALELFTTSPILTPTVIGLMATQYYFATGHQATLASIQWDVAFLFTESIRPPLTHIALILNTLGPFILAGLAVPLTVFYKLSPSPRDLRASEVIMGRVVRAATGAMIYAGGLILLNCIMTFVLRRHLMVWKIFAPRFMLAGASVIAIDGAIVASTFLASKAIEGVFEVFG